MPGPFPGMDPYLESSFCWQSFHNLWIGTLSIAINTMLPPQLVAAGNVRLYVVEPDHTIIPDISVFQRNPVEKSSRGNVAVAEAVDLPKILKVYPETIRESFIEIRMAKPPRKVITVIEVLSAANKAAGTIGHEEYVKKQRELINSDINLLEIDMLRKGAHTVAVPLLEEREGDYMICLHRGDVRYTYEYWPVSMQTRLPRTIIPLLKGMEDLTLDLQAAFDATYDGGAFSRMVEYQQEVDPPLTQENATWADALLREKGLRN